MDADDDAEHRAGHRQDATDEARAAAIERMVRDLDGPVDAPGAEAVAEPAEPTAAAQERAVVAAAHPADAGRDTRRDRRKYLLPAEHADEIIDACRRGVPETQIARALGINYRTWMRVREEDERLDSALAEVKKIEEEQLVSLLLDKARKGDTTSIIFALKGRHGYRDQGPPPGAERPANIIINLPDALAPKEYLRMIDVTPGGKS